MREGKRLTEAERAELQRRIRGRETFGFYGFERSNQIRPKRSRFITLFQAATKSRANFCSAPLDA